LIRGGERPPLIKTAHPALAGRIFFPLRIKS
jgi:hypothetical protein